MCLVCCAGVSGDSDGPAAGRRSQQTPLRRPAEVRLLLLAGRLQYRQREGRLGTDGDRAGPGARPAGEAGRQTGRQAGRQTQTDRQAGRQAGRQGREVPLIARRGFSRP